jgi:hypothetical protein
MLQPSAPTPEPSRPLDQTLASATTTQKRGQADDHIYSAIAEVAASLSVGQVPRAAAAQLIDNDTHEWLALPSSGELGLVSELSTATLRGHLTGRLRVPALLRYSKAEMLERQEKLSERRLAIGNELDAELASVM